MAGRGKGRGVKDLGDTIMLGRRSLGEYGVMRARLVGELGPFYSVPQRLHQGLGLPLCVTRKDLRHCCHISLRISECEIVFVSCQISDIVESATLIQRCVESI